MIDFGINVSAFIAELSDKKRSIYKVVGNEIAEELYDAFEQLVMETPQKTGTAAASWNMDLGKSSGGVRQQEEVELWLYKGHLDAVLVALNAAEGNLDNLSDPKVYGTKDIVVWNDVDYIDELESGELLRPVNQPGGMFGRFEQALWDIALTDRGIEI